MVMKSPSKFWHQAALWAGVGFAIGLGVGILINTAEVWLKILGVL
jgi:hypothetical protein